MTRAGNGSSDDESADGIVRRMVDPRARRRRVALVVVTLVIVPVTLLAVGGLWFWWQLEAPGGTGAVVEVHVERGWGVPRIGDELSTRGVIGSSWVFSIYTRLNGDTKFQAGTYEMRKHMGVLRAVKALKAGPRIDYSTLTVPPGLWLSEVANRVGRLPGRGRDTFVEDTRNNSVRSAFEPEGVSNLEGLLWPDTYKISDSEDEIAVLKEMVQAFDLHAARAGLGTVDVQGRSPYEILVVASLVEAEAKVPEDRPLIASVIYNRLARNMPLQIDATLIYARGDPANRKLADSDRNIDSVFNTYLHTGLPPTPIAMVSEASLRAALAPAQTDFLFYVIADKDGHHAFAKTLAEHERNVEAARQKGLL